VDLSCLCDGESCVSVSVATGLLFMLNDKDLQVTGCEGSQGCVKSRSSYFLLHSLTRRLLLPIFITNNFIYIWAVFTDMVPLPVRIAARRSAPVIGLALVEG
jgi:hypothetical protein